MNYLSLFSGIGGFEKGFQEREIHAKAMVEILPEARYILQKKYPDIELFNDVNRDVFLGEKYDGIVGGFPCQDLSSSGTKAGISGKNSGLIHRVFEITKVIKPHFIVLENVYFMLHLNRGEAARYIIKNFAESGYHWAYRTVDASSFGVPQRRKRVFFIACKSPISEKFFEENSFIAKHRYYAGKNSIGFYWTEGFRSSGLAVDSIPPLKGGSTLGIPSPPAIILPSMKIIKPSINDSERLMGFPKNWTSFEQENFKKSIRWKLIGNAVSPDAANWIAECVEHTINEKMIGKYHSLMNSSFNTPLKMPDCASSGETPVDFLSRDISHFPKGYSPEPIHEFLDDEGTLLSDRAIKGFLKRANSGCLKFPARFIEALQNQLDDQVLAS